MLATYEQDSALIDRIIIMNAGLSGDRKLIRRAGIVDMLGGVANTIKNLVAELVRKEGVIGALSTYLINGALFRIFPLNIISYAATAFGYSPGKMFSWAFNEVKNIIQNKGNFTEDDAKRISEQAAQQLSVSASLEPLHQLNKEGKLSYILQGRGFDEHSESQFVKNGKGLFSKTFGLLNIFKYFGKGKTTFALLGGFFKWGLWAVLMGLAAIEGPKLVANMFGANFGKEPGSETSQSGSGGTGGTGGGPEVIGVPSFVTNMFGSGEGSRSSQQRQRSIQFPKYDHDLTASGAGEKYFINGPNNQWWIKVPGGDIRNVMVQWATKIYPELKGHEAEIRKSKTFDKTAYALARGYDASRMRGWLKVPPSNLHTWRDIVDTFVAEAAMRIKKSKEGKK